MIEVNVNNKKTEKVKLIDVLEKHSDDKIALVRGVCFHGQRSILTILNGKTTEACNLMRFNTLILYISATNFTVCTC